MKESLINKLKASDIALRMTRGALWSFTGTALGKFFVLLTGVICARILGKEGFGELGIVRSTLGMFIILGSGGIGVTATRFIAAYRENDKEHAAAIYRLSNIFATTLGIVTTLLLIVLSSLLAENILNSEKLTFTLIIGTTVLIMSILNSSENGTLAGFEDFRSIAVNTLIASIAEAVGMIVGAYYFQLNGAILGFGLGVFVLYLTNKRSAITRFKEAGIHVKGASIRKNDWQLIYKYSLPATLSALMVTPVFWLIRSMLINTGGYGELGIFEAADQWKVILLFVPGAVCQIVLPILSSITDSRQFKKALLGNLLLIGGISTTLALLAWVSAPVVMPLYGKTFDNPTPLAYLAISTIPTAISQILEMTLYSKDKMWLSLTFNILWGATTILLTYLFLQRGQGAAGIALAILVAYTIKMVCIGGYLFTIKSNRHAQI